jgi:endonuclease/exonuclease/phosphatase family metal-dependent hydrolase
MLSKWPCKWFEMPYESTSGMGRSLLVGEAIINNEPIIVATSHLESLDTAQVRKGQMNEAFPIIKSVPNAFMMGDFNFDSSWQDE